MCGIGGIFNFDSSRNVEPRLLLRMGESIRHRGPDGDGIFTDGNLGLVHKRLSIIDLSDSANQPFVSSDGRYVIAYNGEIYNYKELTRELSADNITFRTSSDTEVILNLYIKHGVAALGKLNGMFSFVIWDADKRELFAARDRLGVKPFYYGIHDGTFYFASEAKALFAAGFPSNVSPDAMDELLLFKYVAGENTVFKSVKRLLPGHYLMVNATGVTKKTWWNLSEKIRENRERIPADPYKWFSETFYSAVDHTMVSDVPVGVMLSAGLDSGSIAVALAKNGNKNVSSFTLTFKEKSYNEGELAKLVADQCGLEYNDVYLSQEDLYPKLAEASWFNDEPLVHQSDAHLLALTTRASQKVKVLLSGEGGDEFMGGYVRYRFLQNLGWMKAGAGISHVLKHIPSRGITNRFEKIARYLQSGSTDDLVMLNACNVYPAELAALGRTVDLESFEYRNSVLDEAKKLYPGEPARQAMHLDIYTHMASVFDRNDRMTMGSGVECRVPFIDHRLIEMIPALPTKYLLRGKKGKHLLYNSVAKNLPLSVLKFKKLGFSVPWQGYLKNNNIFAALQEEISAGSLDSYFDRLDTKRIIDLAEEGVPFARTLFMQLLMIHIWNENYIKRLKENIILDV